MHRQASTMTTPTSQVSRLGRRGANACKVPSSNRAARLPTTSLRPLPLGPWPEGARVQPPPTPRPPSPAEDTPQASPGEAREFKELFPRSSVCKELRISRQEPGNQEKHRSQKCNTLTFSKACWKRECRLGHTP